MIYKDQADFADTGILQKSFCSCYRTSEKNASSCRKPVSLEDCVDKVWRNIREDVAPKSSTFKVIAVL